LRICLIKLNIIKMKTCYYKKYAKTNFSELFDKRKTFINEFTIELPSIWHSKKYNYDNYDNCRFNIKLISMNEKFYIFEINGFYDEYFGGDVFSFKFVWNKPYNLYVFINNYNQKVDKLVSGLYDYNYIDYTFILPFCFKNIPKYDYNY